MIEYKTPETVIAEIKMIRTKFVGTILIIEGDSDYRFLKSFVANDKCYLLPAHGKENAVKCIPLACDSNIKGVLSFIDADHDRILNRLPRVKNIIATDYHDTEMLMVMSEAFDKIIEEYASDVKLKKFIEANDYDNLRIALLKNSVPIGMLRLLSTMNNHNLCFNNISFKKFIDARKLQINIDSLILCVLANTSDHSLQTKTIAKDLKQNIDQNSYDVQQLCNGHDFSEVLAISLRHAIGSCDSKIGNRDNVEKILRLAYNFELFRQTDCYREMISWEEENTGFEIF